MGAQAKAEQFMLKRPDIVAESGIYPTEDGGVVLEFFKNGWDWSIEFGSEMVEVFAVEVGGRGKLGPVGFHNTDEALHQWLKAHHI